MVERDARNLSQDAQEEIRRQAVIMLKKGYKQREVAEHLDVSRARVSSWWLRYKEGGMAALKKKKRGAKKGSSTKLSDDQQRQMQQIITDKLPDQLKLKFALWTREAVRQLIKERFGVDYSLQGISVLIKGWGFTPQRPVKRAYEQRPAEVKAWMEQTYPQIKARAKAENAEIFWGDETAIQPEAHRRRGFAPKGKTPVVRQPAKRFHSSVISAISNQGKMHWMPLKEALNADTFIEFLQRLIKHRKRKIFLIVDNLRVHHSKPVKEWLEENKHRIELFYLPAYSPELNPDEYLNHTIKHEVHKRGMPTNKSELSAKVQVVMIVLSVRTHSIKACFQHPCAKYAA